MTRVLLVECLPWLVALPIAVVGRVLAAEDAPHTPGDGPTGRIGTVSVGGVTHQAWDLGRMFHLPDSALSWALLAGPERIALRVGRCLRVVDAVAAPQAVPGVVSGGRRGLRLLSTAGFIGVTVPFALWIEPSELFTRPAPLLATAGVA